jgi:hypothetical protein
MEATHQILDEVELEKAALEKPKEEDEALKQKAVTYVAFEDLQPFDQDHSFMADQDHFINVEIADMIKDPELWHLQFQALDEFRRMNKFYLRSFVAAVPTYTEFLVCSVDNLRSGISKLSLMLLNEFFQGNHEASAELDAALLCLIEKVMPSVLLKTNYEKVFIQKEARDVMTQALQKCQHKELLKVLLDCQHNKQTVLIENIAGFMGGFINSSKNEFFADYQNAEPARQKILKQLVQELSNGIDAAPRIKK